MSNKLVKKNQKLKSKGFYFAHNSSLALLNMPTNFFIFGGTLQEIKKTIHPL